MAAGELDANDTWQLAAEAARRHPRCALFSTELANAARDGSLPAIAAAADLAETDGFTSVDRFMLLEAALAGADIGPGADVDRLVDGIEGLLVRSAAAPLESRWADALGTNEQLRSHVGPAEADAARIDVLRRVGRIEEARGLATSLFYRAASGALPGFASSDLLALLDELGAPEGQMAELRRLLPVSPSTSPSPTRRVRVLFVGGNEVQARYHAGIDASLAERFSGHVEVEWTTPGWASNWATDAERVERRYDSADAVVLMTFMRTNLGRRIRAGAGAAGLPWIACTGHGRQSLERAIERAVEVVATAHAREGH